MITGLSKHLAEKKPSLARASSYLLALCARKENITFTELYARYWSSSSPPFLVGATWERLGMRSSFVQKNFDQLRCDILTQSKRFLLESISLRIPEGVRILNEWALHFAMEIWLVWIAENRSSSTIECSRRKIGLIEFLPSHGFYSRFSSHAVDLLATWWFPQRQDLVIRFHLMPFEHYAPSIWNSRVFASLETTPLPLRQHSVTLLSRPDSVFVCLLIDKKCHEPLVDDRVRKILSQLAPYLEWELVWATQRPRVPGQILLTNEQVFLWGKLLQGNLLLPHSSWFIHLEFLFEEAPWLVRLRVCTKN